MKRYKKRTIALVLASVVTVVGAFASDNYKNSLMKLDFETSQNGAIKMIVQTKSAYSGNVSPVRKDANTYVLMLPEMNSLASTPNLDVVGGNIESVNIRTMPYSNTAKGYTRITIKTTLPALTILGTNQIYLPSSKTEEALSESRITKEVIKERRSESPIVPKQEKYNNVEQEVNTEKYSESKLEDYSSNTVTESLDAENNIEQNETFEENKYIEQSVDKNSDNTYYLWMLAILILMTSAYCYVRAKNKMQELAGESFVIDTDDEPDSKSKLKKIKKIKETIKVLDEKYPKNTSIINNKDFTFESKQQIVQKEELPKVIVDLDKLYKEQTAIINVEEQEENRALEEFLSGFSFVEDDELKQEQNDSVLLDEAFYNSIINNHKLSFSSVDIDCINQLLGIEIKKETLKNIDKYLVSNPIKQEYSKEKVLEDLILTYSISQKILFTNEDVKVLQKLLDVELDKDFVSDLKTDPKKIEEMEKRFLASDFQRSQTSESIILNVKDMLPDLSQALKNKKSKNIKCEYKPEVVFFSEGYEVPTLSLSGQLPDLTKELKNKNSYTSKPSAEFEVVDSSYVVGDGELKISSELPNLQDVLLNPEKYEDTSAKIVQVDEKALLDSIENVEFKPFYDGTNDFEILNKFDDSEKVSINDAEFNQFENFEIVVEKEEVSQKIEEYDDFNDLYNTEFVDLTSPESLNNESKILEEKLNLINKEVEIIPNKSPIREIPTNKEKKEYKINPPRKEVKKQSDSLTSDMKCMIDGESLVVVSTVALLENKGCHLAKGASGYYVLGYVDDKFFKIKKYETLKSENLQARRYELLQNGDTRFLVKMGLNKFIVDVSADSISYVMDLC